METQNNDNHSLENDSRHNDGRIMNTDVDTILNKQEHALQSRTKI